MNSRAEIMRQLVKAMQISSQPTSGQTRLDWPCLSHPTCQKQPHPCGFVESADDFSKQISLQLQIPCDAPILLLASRMFLEQAGPVFVRVANPAPHAHTRTAPSTHAHTTLHTGEWGELRRAWG
jgi:hypothetical protein